MEKGNHCTESDECGKLIKSMNCMRNWMIKGLIFSFLFFSLRMWKE
jgi:hypothetical protein